MSVNDHEINRGVRGVLTRHWVDLSSTNFASRKGIVRLMGELRRIGPDASTALESTNIVAIDAELRRIRGVQRVHLDLANWRRNEDGDWEPIERLVDTEPVEGGAEGA